VNASDTTHLRILLLLPTARDASLTQAILEDNDLHAHACHDVADLRAQVAHGAGAVLVGEEALLSGGLAQALADLIEHQPPWSDLPVLLLTREGADSLVVGDAVAMLGNVTLLERPMRVSALLSALRSALRARLHQYEIQAHLLQLERARDAEATEARRKDEFLAMLAHELRNPLAPIRNALHVLSFDDSDPERRAALRATMGRQVDHMVRLVDDLLEASRMSHGRIQLDLHPLDLCDGLRSAIELSAPLIEAGCYKLEVDLPDQPLPLNGDPVRIAQVFGNLLNNAAKYGRPGGRIRVRAFRDDTHAVVRVEDDGIGIEPSVLPHVFELFTQGRADRNRLKDGLGIGLALVKQVVELHGGDVRVGSEGRGKGAEFVVRLPLGTQPVEGAAPAQAPDEARTPDDDAMRVLIVDDNTDSARTLALMVELLGMQHRVAHDGPTALSLARAFKPDVGLLDIGMPGMDGYELARALHDDPQHAGMVLIAITGWSRAQDQKQARAAGFADHFRKPADIVRLSALLDATRRNLPRTRHGMPASDAA
jgi:signal transduction histidine kinase/ActR/RegA family two-component response regulator